MHSRLGDLYFDARSFLSSNRESVSSQPKLEGIAHRRTAGHFDFGARQQSQLHQSTAKIAGAIHHENASRDTERKISQRRHSC